MLLQLAANGAPSVEETAPIALRAFPLEPEKIVDTQSHRDGDLTDSDSILIILDTYHDGQNGFLFGTNPSSIQYDAQIRNVG